MTDIQERAELLRLMGDAPTSTVRSQEDASSEVAAAERTDAFAKIVLRDLI